MGVFFRRTAGGLSPYWFGFWQADGKRHEKSLMRWRGTPPGPGEKYGDREFEKSRSEAEALFKQMRDSGKGEAERIALVEKIHAARYGGKVGRVRIDELASRWDALPHKADLTAARRERVHSVLRRFAEFMAGNFPKVKEAGALTAEHFKAFLDSVDESGVSARSWNDYLSILRSVLGKVDGQGAGFREYLARLPKRTENTIHRRPFTGEELEAIFEAAGELDAELRPVLVAAACTALRRGDVCRLRWDAVDMAGGFVTVKTSKTGETVEIPIFPPFMAVLRDAAAKRRKGVPFVFPKVAIAYQQNADGLNLRLRKVLEAAGFTRPGLDADGEGEGGGEYPAPASPGDAVKMVERGMRREGWTERRRKLGLGILERHLEGETGKAIAEALEVGRATVSEYLHAMESAGRVALVSPPKVEIDPARATLAEVRDGEQRKQRGSLCGWHSFRTTFCTLALANGVPMEILRKITGHKTAEIVLKHYDRRGREQMRKAFGEAMPKAIVGAVSKPGEDAELVAVSPGLAALLDGATAEQLEAVEKLLKRRAGK